jgi:protein gp37
MEYMGEFTEVEWTHRKRYDYVNDTITTIPGHTWSPWWGCVNISPACNHCYAETRDKRKMLSRETHWGKEAPRRMQSDHYWDDPLRWNRRAARTGFQELVFCGSMCDVMERRADLSAPRKRLFRLIEATPNLIWTLLTKRPQEYVKCLPDAWLETPRPNVCLLTTVEAQDYLPRIDELLKAPAVVHGISVEPMLGPIKLPANLLHLGNRAWVIAGGESGPGARPSHPDWFRDLRNQCVRAGVPLFFKQWGEHDSGLVRIGKHKAGRLLDGQEWSEFPLELS